MEAELVSYYLTAEFKSEEDAEIAFVIAKEIIEDYARLIDDLSNVGLEEPAKKWLKKLLKKHKLAKELIDIPEEGTVWDFITRYNLMLGSLETYENKVHLAGPVWSLTDWDFIAKLFIKLGAIRCRWINIDSEDVKYHKLAGEGKCDEEFISKIARLCKSKEAIRAIARKIKNPPSDIRKKIIEMLW